MLGYLSLDIICSSKLTVFLELRSRKTLRFSEQIIFADKYLSIFSRQMAAIVYISNKGEWNNCFSKFSNQALPLIFISTILQSVRKENLAHYFPYDVKLGLLADSRRFLANQKARNAIVGAENLLILDIL